MSFLAGPVWAALALLVVAGAPKVVRPHDTMRALRMMGLRVPHVSVRTFGAIEAAIGLGALLTGNGILLWCAALSYLGFAAFVAWALRRETPLSSCGCFGKADTPPTMLHLVTVAAFALVLGAAALRPALEVALAYQLAHNLGLTLTTAGFAGVICWLAYAAMTILPTVYAKPASAQFITEGRKS